MILASSLLFSQTTSTDTTLDEALELYKQEKYDQAFDAFLLLVDKDLASVELTFHLARSAFKAKKYSEAIAAYERILIMHPNHHLAKLELARTHFYIDQYKLSSKYFNEVLQANPPLQVKINIAKYIKKIKKKYEPNSITGVLQVGTTYDSNINGASTVDTFYVPAFGATFTNTALNAQDWSHQEVVIVHHVLDKHNDWGFAIKNDFTLYSKSLDTYSDFNILYINYSPAISWKFDKLFLDIGVSQDRMWFGGDYFLENHAAFSKLFYKHSLTDNYMVMIKDITKNYQQSTFQARDAKQEELTLSYQTRLNTRWSLFLREVVQIERKIAGTSKNVDYDSYDTNLGATYLWSARWRLNMLLAYKELNYKDKDPYFLTEHLEKRYSLKLGVKTLITESVSIDSSILGLRNDSTVELSDYERFAFSFNLNKTF